MDNLKILYLNKNDLITLACLKNIKFNNLEEFWAKFNKINDAKEIENLENKNTIEKICLNDNIIKNTDNEFLKIVSLFPNLKELNLTSNQIDLNKNKEIINKIEEKRITLII